MTAVLGIPEYKPPKKNPIEILNELVMMQPEDVAVVKRYGEWYTLWIPVFKRTEHETRFFIYPDESRERIARLISGSVTTLAATFNATFEDQATIHVHERTSVAISLLQRFCDGIKNALDTQSAFLLERATLWLERYQDLSNTCQEIEQKLHHINEQAGLK